MSDNTEVIEQQRLIEKILSYGEFTRAPYCADVVLALWRHRNDADGIRPEELAKIIYKERKPKDDPDNVADPIRSMRVLCGQTRAKLWSYSGTDEGMEQKWCCALPDASRGMGYKLTFLNQWELAGPSGRFWQAHREEGRKPVLVYSEPLFFRNKNGTMVLRWYDVNLDETTNEDAVELLRKRHPELASEELYPSFQYMLSGESGARQGIREWFQDVAWTRLPELNVRRINSSAISSSSPIFLGNPYSNRMMRALQQSTEGRLGEYSVDMEKFGVTRITRVAEEEREVLKRVMPKNGPSKKSVEELQDVLEPDSYLFGVVTRMPNPYGDGVVTMISAHQTRAVEQMARTLINDKRLQKLQAAGWPKDDRFPGHFQALFAIRVGPVNVDMEAREPELIGTRRY